MEKTRISSKVKQGSVWTSVSGEKYVVMLVTKKASDVWIVYRKKDAFSTYSCLEPAFLQRFSPFENK